MSTVIHMIHLLRLLVSSPSSSTCRVSFARCAVVEERCGGLQGNISFGGARDAAEAAEAAQAAQAAMQDQELQELVALGFPAESAKVSGGSLGCCAGAKLLRDVAAVSDVAVVGQGALWVFWTRKASIKTS